MVSRAPFATIAEIEARHPRELLVLAANETTRQLDAERVNAALVDVSTEIRAILAARYSAAELDALDEESLGVLKLYAIDMALYRVALSFARQTDTVRERYTIAVKRLEAIASGKGGLSFAGSVGVGGGVSPGEPASINPNEVVLVAPERVMTRARFRGLP
ncbi:MAG: DUF1320 family protein [Parvibaculum sp.]|uniref:phage protein Gp36 family protein n=1 Tax=Chelatococcus sp. TaxID=1953771 RepID=UPI001EBA260F|nr:phage protein Gp36 family protein [Chelatococcus sp.]MBX3506839.1 DUF1320 family protein [Parvibaculum sp.]MBX3545586.1 DUF1320 family protein [Chelatococcus sp.]